jgi:hypothetical protein
VDPRDSYGIPIAPDVQPRPNEIRPPFREMLGESTIATYSI